MSEREKIAEIIASAAYEHDNKGKWPDDMISECNIYRIAAHAEIRALEAAGFAIVPVEPTEERIQSGKGKSSAISMRTRSC